MTESPGIARIAFCITTLDPGGAERQLVRIATGLNRAEFAPEVLYFKGEGELAGPLREADIPVTCLKARHQWDFTLLRRLRKHFQTTRPQLVQSFLHHANILSRIAARQAKVPHVVSGIRVAERRPGPWLLFDRLTQRWVDLNVCVSRDVARFSIEQGRLPAEKITVIPNAVATAAIAAAEPADLAEWGVPAGAPAILCIGRLDEQKNPLLLLRAFQNLPVCDPQPHLLFAGIGPLAEILSSAAQNSPNIHFLGFRSDIPSLLKASTCLVLPSRWEGMPNVVLEAMAVGTPVVASVVEGVRELLGDSPLLFTSESEPELRAALEQVLDDPQAAKSDALELQQFVQKEFAPESVISRYELLYRKLLAGPPVPDGAETIGRRVGKKS